MYRLAVTYFSNWVSKLVFLDIDECMLDTNGCDQSCINTPGSFMCNCSEGYILNENGFSCYGESILEL